MEIFYEMTSGYCYSLQESVEYLDELERLKKREGVSHQDDHFDIVPLEAMTAYKPVIACKSGGLVASVKDGGTGFLCYSTSEEFSLAMAKLIQDPQVACRMG
ncbi:unnamed protein product [Dovyalis caffra]|uniref:Glycosyl transferase family 1 domain-containing protein n=1 Tax=Dovyalis caffra TaxID=77055 RepID=A0AAV1QQH4_9ROSI|nr:unnamed protein product [Dovyalis caffra]